jgi:phage tail-like protein
LEEPAMPRPERPYTGAKFALSLAGRDAGWIYSAEGGMPSTDVVTEKLGQENLVRKRVGNLKYEDITLSFGLGMSRQFYDWIKASFDNKPERRDGAILTCNYNAEVISSLEFSRALITEVTFPALDAASKDAAKMTVKISPEYTKVKHSPGGSVDPSKYSISGKQKLWSPANFRLSIDGLDSGCKHVNKIEALTLKQKVLEVSVGELRGHEREPSHLEMPNLSITLAESAAQKFHDWHDKFVVNGHNDESNEKTGTLEYLTSNLKTVLFTLNFHNLGIYKLTTDKREGGSENILRCKAEMYCEEMHFEYDKNSTW